MAQRKAPFPLDLSQCDAIIVKIRNGQQSPLEQATLMASIYCDFLQSLFAEATPGTTPSQEEMEAGTDGWVVNVDDKRLKQDFLFCAIMLQRHMPALSKRVAQWFRDMGVTADDDRTMLYQYFLFRHRIATGGPPEEVKSVDARLRDADRVFLEYDLAKAAEKLRLENRPST